MPPLAMDITRAIVPMGPAEGAMASVVRLCADSSIVDVGAGVIGRGRASTGVFDDLSELRYVEVRFERELGTRKSCIEFDIGQHQVVVHRQ